MSNKVVIVTDSTADLLPETYKERNIVVIPLLVVMNGKSYEDSIEITANEMYKMVEKTGELPKTSGVSSEKFVEVFTKIYKENDGCDIVYTGIGGKLSTTLQSASIAREDLDFKDHIYLMDSEALSTGTGLMVLKMCDLRDQGKSGKEIVETVKKMVPCVRTQFTVNALDYLHKGGRCSGTKKFFGTMLRVRPFLKMFEGVLTLADKAYGRYEKALDMQIKDLYDHIDIIDKDYLFITDSGECESSKYIFNHISDDIKKQFKHVYLTHAGCVISSHCGPETVGILYLRNKPLKDVND